MKKIKAQVSNEIFLASSQIDAELEKLFQRELTFSNPKLGELLRMGYSIWKVPKRIICFKKLKAGYYLPLGFGPRLWQFITDRGDQLLIDDQRIEKPVAAIRTSLQLKPEQLAVHERLLKNNRCILEAKPGFGKTMLGISVIAHRAQKTLVIVHTRALLEQWLRRVLDYCQLSADEIGLIGEGKWKIGDRLTIASYQTLLSRGSKQLRHEFGLVVVDECHHVPANTFAKVVRDFAAKYCLGLTATPFRKDKLDKLMNFYIGKIIPTSQLTDSSTQTLLPESKVKTTLFWRETDLEIPHWEEKEFTELGSILSQDQARLKQVVSDILTVAQDPSQKILVLSERVGHAEAIYHLLHQLQPKLPLVLVTGQMKKADRARLFEEIRANKYQIMVATGGVVGEGFDWPALNHLFLTFPFSWRGKLIQYVGRAQRVAPGKTQAFVYDYIDRDMGIFRAMQTKRLRGYRELGVIFS